MKAKGIIIFIMFLSTKLFAQDSPPPSIDYFKQFFKDQSYWTKIILDSNFQETSNDKLAKYEYYDFRNNKGYYSLTYSRNKGFIKRKFKNIYTRTEPYSSLKLLNGVIDVYDKNGHMHEKYIFKDGFYTKVYYYWGWGTFKNKYNGKLRGVIEYAPGKDIESWGNFFDKFGNIDADSHEISEATGIKHPPIRETSISLSDSYIGQVWQNAEFDSYKYNMFIDTVAHYGKKSASIKSIDKKIKGSGMLKQTCKANKFLDKRIRMTAYMKSENVNEWANLFLRVGEASSEFISYDNMKDRRIKGTTPWTKYELVLEVPPDASTIRFGALIHGIGQIWFDDITFEIVDDSVKTTGEVILNPPLNTPSEPSNLNFEN